jgi:hypothetical protein
MEATSLDNCRTTIARRSTRTAMFLTFVVRWKIISTQAFSARKHLPSEPRIGAFVRAPKAREMLASRIPVRRLAQLLGLGAALLAASERAGADATDPGVAVLRSLFNAPAASASLFAPADGAGASPATVAGVRHLLRTHDRDTRDDRSRRHRLPRERPGRHDPRSTPTRRSGEDRGPALPRRNLCGQRRRTGARARRQDARDRVVRAGAEPRCERRAHAEDRRRPARRARSVPAGGDAPRGLLRDLRARRNARPDLRGPQRTDRLPQLRAPN